MRTIKIVETELNLAIAKYKELKDLYEQFPNEFTSSRHLILSYDGCIGFLPESVAHRVGISRSGDIGMPGGTLQELNDSGKSFTEIADIIELYLE
jgi:hypothetical protein